MTKIIEGDLILTKDTTFEESIIVKGDIRGPFNLEVAGDINAWDIYAGDIYARNIDARDIICEKRTKKEATNKTIARIFIQNKSKLERKEWN